MKWLPQSLEIMEGISHVANTFSTGFCATMRASDLEGEIFNLTEKHTYNNMNVLITCTRWQLDKDELQLFKNPKRGGRLGLQ